MSLPPTHPPTICMVSFFFPLFPLPPSTTFRLYIQALHHDVFFLSWGVDTPIYGAALEDLVNKHKFKSKSEVFCQKNSRTVVHGRDGGCNETSHT